MWYIHNHYTAVIRNYIITKMKVPDHPEKNLKKQWTFGPAIIVLVGCMSVGLIHW